MYCTICFDALKCAIFIVFICVAFRRCCETELSLNDLSCLNKGNDDDDDDILCLIMQIGQLNYVLICINLETYHLNVCLGCFYTEGLKGNMLRKKHFLTSALKK